MKDNPYVENVFAISPNSNNDQLSSFIRENNFDGLLVLVNDPLLSKVFNNLKKIPVRIGPLSKPKSIFQFTHPVIQKRSRSMFNEAEYNLELLKIFDPNINVQIKPKVYIQADEQKQLRTKFPDLFLDEKRIIIFHSGMAGSALNWNQNNYSTLLDKLSRLDIKIILTGNSVSEKERNQRLQDSVNKRNLFNFSGKLSLRELATLYSLSNIYIGPSTGPTHIANAVGLKVFSFYPPIKVQSKKRWQPYLGNSTIFSPDIPCDQKYKCIKQKCKHYYCMDLITVEEVFEAIKREVR